MGRVIDDPNTRAERETRRRTLGGAVAFLLLFSLGARADDLQGSGGATSYKAQIIAVATRETRSLLEAHGIDPSGIWVVEFVPPCETGSVCFGGGFDLFPASQHLDRFQD